MGVVYIVLYNGQVSSEGYKDIVDAVEFIETRCSNPVKDEGWLWVDDKGNRYQIKDIVIR